jgi:hypothetical protein
MAENVKPSCENFQIGDDVRIIEQGDHYGQFGTVFKISGQDVVVLTDGDRVKCPSSKCYKVTFEQSQTESE